MFLADFLRQKACFTGFFAEGNDLYKKIDHRSEFKTHDIVIVGPENDKKVVDLPRVINSKQFRQFGLRGLGPNG